MSESSPTQEAGFPADHSAVGVSDPRIKQEASRRRTFAIISHPDAGKTTLTEKLLLYGGALELAGSVTAKKNQRETASDWMELEKKRGISISSTVLQFNCGPYRLNLLDTPGHKDFSEDTYRVLMAVDAVIMVIDAGKGIESQTLKLFEICRKRKIPIFTFMNKLDRPARASLALIDQLETDLGLRAYPVNWPLGSGSDFKGIFDRQKKDVHLFERVPGGAYQAPVRIGRVTDSMIKDLVSEKQFSEIIEELELLDQVQGALDLAEVHRGQTTPVFFGSAANNFGVAFLLEKFLEYATEPLPRLAESRMVIPEYPRFTAFVFKVQTNMNPLHRDRVVFARVCSGRFERDMRAHHSRLGRPVRLSDSFNLFGQDREIVNEAFPGDIIGFVTRLDFRVGDTLSEDPSIVYREIPRFAPECFAYIRNTSTASIKAFRKGLEHLLTEDIVQALTIKDSGKTTPLLGAVGPLQFEVLQYRLKDEYGAETVLDQMPWTRLRWLKSASDEPAPARLDLPLGAALGEDDQHRPVVLFASEWSMGYFTENNPRTTLLDTPEAYRAG